MSYHNDRALMSQLLLNKWNTMAVDADNMYDYSVLSDKENEIFNSSQENTSRGFPWYLRKFLFWMDQLSENPNSVPIDVSKRFVKENEWDEMFANVSFGELAEDVMNMMTKYSSQDIEKFLSGNTLHHSILYRRYEEYFDEREIIESIIDGIMCYSWLVAMEANIPLNSKSFTTIVRTKHNLILSSLENNESNDNLKGKLISKDINPPSLLAFHSRKQLLPEFYGEKAEMILKRAEAEDSEIIDPEKMEDGFYECNKCGKRKTRHQEMQTRSADEPMTIFVRCYLCHVTWKEL